MQATSPMPASSPADANVVRLQIPTSRRLPGSRAVVGGLLVALAALGTFAAATGAGGDDRRQVVVAARDLPAGTRLQASDLKVVQAEVDPALGATTMGPQEIASGTAILGPIRSGEVIQAGLLATKAAESTGREMSFSLAAARAVGGTLRSGDIVDVLVSDKSNASLAARTVAVGVRVLRVDRAGSGGLGASGEVMITVSLATTSEAAALTAAVDTGQVTLVRTTGITPPSPAAVVPATVVPATSLTTVGQAQ